MDPHVTTPTHLEGVRPFWVQPRLFGEPDVIARITMGYYGSTGQCSFAGQITALPSDELLALWVHVNFPMGIFPQVAHEGVDEVLEAVYSLR